MNRLLIVGLALVMSGCSFIMPIPHDGELYGRLVDTQVELHHATCQDKDWADLQDELERLVVYATKREDPQATNLQQMDAALRKAKASSNEKFCESVLKLQRSRLDVVFDAWSGR